MSINNLTSAPQPTTEQRHSFKTFPTQNESPFYETSNVDPQLAYQNRFDDSHLSYTNRYEDQPNRNRYRSLSASNSFANLANGNIGESSTDHPIVINKYYQEHHHHHHHVNSTSLNDLHINTEFEAPSHMDLNFLQQYEVKIL